MRKAILLVLTLVIAMLGVSASANTVYTRITVDREAVGKLLTDFELSDDQKVLVDPILALVNALGVKVTTVEDGAQIDLDLNGEEVNSLGLKMDDTGITIADTLFPNYLLTARQDTVTQLMGEFKVEKLDIGKMGGIDMNAMSEAYGSYCQEWLEACNAASQPGEPETGEFEIDGIVFDTRVPVTVDVPAITEATRKLMDDLMADPVAAAMIKSSSIGMAQSVGESIDEANFEEEVKAGTEEWTANMPDSVTAEYYISSQDDEIFYLVGDSFFEGKDEASCHYQMMIKGDGIWYAGYWDYRTGMILGFEYADQGFRADFTEGDAYMGIVLNIEPGEPKVIGIAVYYLNPDKPLADVRIDISEDGERTLLLDTAGKTLLDVEEIMNNRSGPAAQGLLGDIIINGLGSVMNTVLVQVPEVSGLLGMSTGSGMSGPEEPEEVPQVEVDTSEWKTLADVRSLKTGNSESTWDDERYIYIFDYAGTMWMVTAEFSKEIRDAYNNVDFFADDRNEQIEAILGPCKIISVIDLKTLAIPQEELDQWIGKTGQDLLDAGWEYNGYTYVGKSLHINMINGRIEYLVSFEEEIEAPASFDQEPDYAGDRISGIRFHSNSYHFFDEEYSDNP